MNNQPTERTERKQGPKVYLEDGTPVRIGVLDERGEHIPYSGSPEQGFYVYEKAGGSATVVLEKERDRP